MREDVPTVLYFKQSRSNYKASTQKLKFSDYHPSHIYLKHPVTGTVAYRFDRTLTSLRRS